MLAYMHIYRWAPIVGAAAYYLLPTAQPWDQIIIALTFGLAIASGWRVGE